jgi:hypothetical protein
VDGYQDAAGSYTLTLTCTSAQVCDHPLTGVSLSGPSSGETGETLAFTASPQPPNATLPIAYTWSADGLLTGQGTSSATYRWDTAGGKTVQVTARNCGDLDFSDSQPVDVTEPCTQVADVDLSLVSVGDIYTGTVVAFSADIAPDSAGKPYTYTIDYDDGHTATSTSSDDPLTTALNHTFDAAGTYDVEIKVWNCDMTEAQAATDSARVVVDEYGEDYAYIYLPLVMRSR